MRRSWLALAALLAAGPAAGDDLAYELPAAGSYALPAITRVAPHWLLAADGTRAELPDCPPGGVAVVGFVYLGCTDASGCPLSLSSFQRLDRALASHRGLATRVRLATVSFDPAHDGPAQMAQLRHHMSPRGDWRFLTAASAGALRPILEDYGQNALPLVTASGAAAGRFRHVTKVFLIDDTGAVRNIYSTGFLDPRLVLRDIETLLLPPS